MSYLFYMSILLSHYWLILCVECRKRKFHDNLCSCIELVLSAMKLSIWDSIRPSKQPGAGASISFAHISSYFLKLELSICFGVCFCVKSYICPLVHVLFLVTLKKYIVLIYFYQYCFCVLSDVTFFASDFACKVIALYI